MSFLILIKHSLPEIKEDIPAREWNLSDMGKVRAEKLAGRLKPYRLEALVSSVEPKAQQTAEIVGGVLGLTYATAKNLHEHDRGNAPFYPKQEFQSVVRKFFEMPDTLIFGAETANQVLGRFRDALELTLNSFAGRRTAIVTHGTVISLFVSSLTRINPYRFWQRLGLPAYVVLDMDDHELLDVENVT
jgi:broad specificity phosphatase PhoE